MLLQLRCGRSACRLLMIAVLVLVVIATFEFSSSSIPRGAVEAVLDSFLAARRMSPSAAGGDSHGGDMGMLRSGGATANNTASGQRGTANGNHLNRTADSTASSTLESPSTTTTATTNNIDSANSRIDELIENGGAHPRFRVYAFAPDFLHSNNYLKYDYSRIKTLCLFGINLMDGWERTLNATQTKQIENVVSEAHSHGVQVDVATSYPVAKFNDDAHRNSFLSGLIKFVRRFDLDGVNVDVEDPIDAGDYQSQQALTGLLADIRTCLYDNSNDNAVASPADRVGSSRRKFLSFDAAWSPAGIDNRNYNYTALTSVVDMIFVMAYDMQSQIWDVTKCTGRANSPLPRVRRGLQEFLRLPGLTPSKLVLGVPWYGYDYPCRNLTVTNAAATLIKKSVGNREPHAASYMCQLDLVPFRGAPCSDAAGREVGLSKLLLEKLPKSPAKFGGVRFDDISMSPYFVYDTAAAAETTSSSSSSSAHAKQQREYEERTYRYHMVRFDCPRSLSLKYLLAKELKLAGVGFWNVDSLDYGGDEAVEKIRRGMFQALDTFLGDAEGTGAVDLHNRYGDSLVE